MTDNVSTLGKSNFATREWAINDVKPRDTDSVVYMGVSLSNDNKVHREDRINATPRACYALQGAGVCQGELYPDTMTHIYAIRHVLTSGLQSVYQNKMISDEVDKLQNKVLKSTLGFGRCCKNLSPPTGVIGAKNNH